MEVLLFPYEIETYYGPTCPFYGCSTVACSKYTYTCGTDEG